MKTITFAPNTPHKYKIAILIKKTSMNEEALQRYYVDPLIDLGILPREIVAIELDYSPNNKVTAKQAKDYVELLVPYLNGMNIEYILCADSAYFTQITKVRNPDRHIANVHKAAVKDIEHINVCYTLNHSALVYNPAQKEKITTSLETLVNHMGGVYQETRIKFKSERYPTTINQIHSELMGLLNYPKLVVDIETFSLRLGQAGIASIGFAHSVNEGCAFLVDYRPATTTDGLFGYRHDNHKVRKILKWFFKSYQGVLIAHKSSFDFKQVIFELFMAHPLDKVGMLEGLEVLTRCFEDTKIMAYCCLNSTSRVEYSLKALALPYAGNYAESEIKDIRKIEPFRLLRYNLTDCCSTFWVFEKYAPMLAKEDQEQVYYELMLPMQKVLIQAEIHGMPMYEDRIQEVKQKLHKEQDKQMAIIQASPYVATVTKLIQHSEMVAANAKLKTKQHPIEKFQDIEFNPGSPKQLARLLFEVMDLPVLAYTPTKQPAVDGDTVESLINHCGNADEKALLEALGAYFKVSKITSTFIPAFEAGFLKADGYRYLHGNFNIGGTVSGRLSSSDPNLQNLPAGSEYGKMIKYIFGCNDGRLMVGADYTSLEDYISALLSKDPNKLKIYLEGYDSHCYRAFAYWPHKMPDIVMTVDSINSIKKKYSKIRNDSKAPTFLLTYGGTWMGLGKNCGLPENEAKRIENAYHVLYKVSDDYTAGRIQEASRLGYTELAFGFRLRTPLLKNTVVSSKQAIRESKAEARTVGNAFGQSYGMLNNRSMIAFMNKVWESPYKYDIMPIAAIHDASYYVITDDVHVLKFVNDFLIEEMKWQDLPEIEHDQVKLGGNLDVFYKSWNQPITLENDIPVEQILKICRETAIAEYDHE